MTRNTPPPAPPLSGEGRQPLGPPSLPGKGVGGLGLFLHALTFLVFLSLWTWKLLEPYPVPEDISDELEKAGLSFAAAKTLHATGYAFLTVLAGTMPVSWRWSRWLVVFLVLHGAGTEILQDVMDLGRTGKFRDVLIDWTGIAAGVLGLWRARRPRGPAG